MSDHLIKTESQMAADRRGVSGLFDAVIRAPHFGIAVIVLVSTVFNFFLVFALSDYDRYLTSDMHGYWERAHQIFSGDEMTPNTWVSNAPFYSRVIAVIFTWLNFFHLNDYFLEFLLSINILMSAIGNVALYFIGLRMFGSRKPALWLAGLYAFAYPNLYFNTFLLGEPFAVPLIIAALCLMMYLKDSYKIWIAGALLAFAVGVRPSNGLLGLPCGLYILFAGTSLKGMNSLHWWKTFMPRIVKAGLFSVAFFFVIFTIVAENYRVSKGELRGITAHSGYNFFLGQTQAHKIVSRFDGLVYGFVPSSVAGNPEFGTVDVNIPIYDSARFFEEGGKILKQNPELWVEHLAKFKHLFFDNLFPAVPGVWGFEPLMDIYRYLTFYMLIIGVGLCFISLRERVVRVSDFLLFSSIFALCTLSLYLFTVTHQYFTNFSYTVYVLFVMGMTGAVRHFHRYRRYLAVFFGGLAIVVGGYYLIKANYSWFIDEKIHITVVENKDPIFRVSQERAPTNTSEFWVDELNFVPKLKLTHSKLGAMDFESNFFLTAEVNMRVAEDGVYMFHIYADDGYEVLIDGRRVMGHEGLKKMDEFQVRQNIPLKQGDYRLTINMFQNGVLSGLVGYHRRIDNITEYAPWEFDTKKGKGHYIGEDSESIQFYPID